MSEAPSRRIPNLLHLLLFLALTIVTLALVEGVTLALTRQPLRAAVVDERLQLVVNAVVYLATLALAWLLFPAVWHRPFSEGLHWNGGKARPALVAAGLGLGVLSQVADRYLPTPNKMPVEDVFRTPGIIWLLAGFGTLVAPLFEEIVFRGFLLPGLAIAVDWLRLPRGGTEDAAAGYERWRESDGSSTVALVTSSLLTSLLFAAIHAPQLGLNMAPVALLVVVSLVLCWIRIRTGSVAASTLVHACYNFSIFLSLFIGTGGFRHMDRM